jgi:malonyl CoA-acyl carrier protein transacylase
LFPGLLDSAHPLDRFSRERPDLHDLACTVVGADPFVRALKDTRFEQPALVALGLARWERYRDSGGAALVVGWAAGELAALAAAGSMSPVDAVWLAAVRGRLMSTCAAERGVGTLVLRDATPSLAVQLAAAHELAVAYDDGFEGIAITGRQVLVEAASRTARRLGVRAEITSCYRGLPSPLLASALDEWAMALDAADFRAPKSLVFSCSTTRPVSDARAALLEGFTRPARLRETRTALVRMGLGPVTPVVTSPGCVAPSEERLDDGLGQSHRVLRRWRSRPARERQR